MAKIKNSLIIDIRSFCFWGLLLWSHFSFGFVSLDLSSDAIGIELLAVNNLYSQNTDKKLVQTQSGYRVTFQSKNYFVISLEKFPDDGVIPGYQTILIGMGLGPWTHGSELWSPFFRVYGLGYRWTDRKSGIHESSQFFGVNGTPVVDFDLGINIKIFENVSLIFSGDISAHGIILPGITQVPIESLEWPLAGLKINFNSGLFVEF